MADSKRPAKKAAKKAAKKSASSSSSAGELEDVLSELEAAPAVDVTLDAPHLLAAAGATVPDQDTLADPPALSAELARVAGDDVRTVAGACRWAWSQVKANVDDYFGLCLMFVRMCLGVDPLYPDAITAWREADRKVREDRPHEIPRGYATFYRGGEHGHVVLSLGDGYCISTDIRDRGQANKCKLSAITEAWGYELLGYVKDLNGEVAPRETNRRKVSTRDWRIRRLRAAVTHARNAGNMANAERLAVWLRELRDRAASTGR